MPSIPRGATDYRL